MAFTINIFIIYNLIFRQFLISKNKIIILQLFHLFYINRQEVYGVVSLCVIVLWIMEKKNLCTQFLLPNKCFSFVDYSL